MSKIIIANFKANGCKEFFNNWFSDFKNDSQNQILLAPPSVYLDFFPQKNLTLSCVLKMFVNLKKVRSHLNILLLCFWI